MSSSWSAMMASFKRIRYTHIGNFFYDIPIVSFEIFFKDKKLSDKLTLYSPLTSKDTRTCFRRMTNAVLGRHGNKVKKCAHCGIMFRRLTGVSTSLLQGKAHVLCYLSCY